MRLRETFAFCLTVLVLQACGGGDSAVTGPDGAKTSADAAPAVDVPALADVPQAVVDNPAIGKVCQSNSDCKDGLFCQETNAATGEGFCSKACASDGECGAGRYCNLVAQKLVCTEPKYCNPCTSAADCSAAAPLCLTDSKGKGYCTRKCAVGDSTCVPGSTCKQYGANLNESACKPDYGSCSGDGSHCSPCVTQADCSSGTKCFTSSETAERFCAQICDVGAAAGCAKGFECVGKPGTGNGLCWKTTADKPVATCAAGNKGYCDACKHDYECGSNKCAEKNGQTFCVQPAPCAKATEQTDCPYGGEATFCVGGICAPPPAYNCQGFKACLGHACNADQACDAGICKNK